MNAPNLDKLENLMAHKNPEHKYFVHENQIETAKSIINTFNHGSHYVLLCAEMQSGKTGTFSSVSYMIQNNPELLKHLKLNQYEGILNVYIITGMAEADLFTQITDDFEGNNGEKFYDWQKLKNYDLKKIVESKNNGDPDALEIISKMRNNSLIIIDESHHGTGEKMKLNTFMTEVMESSIAGDCEHILKERNCYVLSVSATPIDEKNGIYQDKTNEYVNKKTIILKPGEGYYGIRDMMYDTKVLRESFNIKTDEDVKRFLDLIDLNEDPGHILIRKQEHSIISDYIAKHKLPFTCQSYNCESIRENSIRIDKILNKKPEKNNIILLQGLLRAGKVLKNKNYLKMVFDTAESNTAATAQSLLGRCCGYNVNKKTLIYCDLRNAELYCNWVENDFKFDDNTKVETVNTKPPRDQNERFTQPINLEQMTDSVAIPVNMIDKSIVRAIQKNKDENIKGYPKFVKEYLFNNFILPKDKKYNNIIKLSLYDGSKKSNESKYKKGDYSYAGGTLKGIMQGKTIEQVVGQTYIMMVTQFESNKLKSVNWQEERVVENKPKITDPNDPTLNNNSGFSSKRKTRNIQ